MDTIEPQLISIIDGRMATYGLLSRLYHQEVDEGLLDELVTMHFATNTGDSDVDDAYRLMHGYLNRRWERTVTELAVDYARVFLGNGVNAYSAAYPFESVHTSSKRLLMQDARDKVVAIYHANKVTKQDSWKVGEDHIALELEFMRILASRCRDALLSGDEDAAARLLMAQYDFLQQHLLNWVPMLNTEIQRFAQTDFYRALGKLTLGFLHTDRELLEELLAEELSAIADDASDSVLDSDDTCNVDEKAGIDCPIEKTND
jgi:TorA maturation chaperone TorD